ncbi:MAG: hypothetical protein WBQ60_06195 [Asticcacaulis sp.]
MRKSLTLMHALLLMGAATMVVPNIALAKAAYREASAKDIVGWTATPTDNGRYVVTFTGDTRMKAEKVKAYAYLRAAELTKESGNEWFAVLSSKTQPAVSGAGADIASHGGSFMGNGPSASSGAGSDVSAGNGGGNSSVPNGPTNGGFGGGGDIPGQVLERWGAKTNLQTILIIQPGKGDQASFPGAVSQPEIFAAEDTIKTIKEAVK